MNRKVTFPKTKCVRPHRLSCTPPTFFGIPDFQNQITLRNSLVDSCAIGGTNRNPPQTALSAKDSVCRLLLLASSRGASRISAATRWAGVAPLRAIAGATAICWLARQCLRAGYRAAEQRQERSPNPKQPSIHSNLTRTRVFTAYAAVILPLGKAQYPRD